MPMPAQPDFDIPASETSWIPKIEDSHSAQGRVQVEYLAQAFSLKAKLCVILGRILESRYLLLNNSPGAAIGTEAMYYPDPNSSTNSEFWQCDRELEYWRANFQTFLQTTPENIAPDIAYLNQGSLRLIFFSTVMALHRPLLRYPCKFSPWKSGSEIYSLKRVENASCQIICILKNLQGRKLASNMNGVGAVALLPAIIFHLIRIKSLDPNESIGNYRHFETGKLILAEWQNRYPFAEFCLFLVESATLKLDVFPAPFSNTPGPKPRGGCNPRDTPSIRLSLASVVALTKALTSKLNQEVAVVLAGNVGDVHLTKDLIEQQLDLKDLLGHVASSLAATKEFLSAESLDNTQSTVNDLPYFLRAPTSQEIKDFVNGTSNMLASDSVSSLLGQLPGFLDSA
ncbi:hypothetical protein BDV33DRAFT_204446 [Aspergillus novoparasiticus]|uniref:Transcription factor domain-containing protein n=1 Tax=Aspergillus novoparasiticus TaxID=986946 RepID=A0A5N6EPJ9_9EURO|nr:hypothetical protein BDV33DRAFT_204446 [Aspergillus novoparasiticus]